jgi:mannose-6-phosphate isomerase
MPAVKLNAHSVEKPWGRTELSSPFKAFENGRPIGEIWFDAPERDPELLVKYLFTGARLSVQVHPDDHAARAAGFARGKDEAWFVLDAQQDSTIALGPTRSISKSELHHAALEGDIVDLLDWRPVRRGDFIYSPAGTIHAISGGITLVELGQNLDLTYRLYDYGRSREVQVEDAVGNAVLTPFQSPTIRHEARLLASGARFVVERLTGIELQCLLPSTALLVPLSGKGSVAGQDFEAGECWEITGQAEVRVPADALALLTYPGATPF